VNVTVCLPGRAETWLRLITSALVQRPKATIDDAATSQARDLPPHRPPPANAPTTVDSTGHQNISQFDRTRGK
jgi:hypothetical protein